MLKSIPNDGGRYPHSVTADLHSRIVNLAHDVILGETVVLGYADAFN